MMRSHLFSSLWMTSSCMLVLWEISTLYLNKLHSNSVRNSLGLNQQTKKCTRSVTSTFTTNLDFKMQQSRRSAQSHDLEFPLLRKYLRLEEEKEEPSEKSLHVCTTCVLRTHLMCYWPVLPELDKTSRPETTENWSDAEIVSDRKKSRDYSLEKVEMF